MKKRIAAGLLGGIFVLAAAGNVQAKTTSYDLGERGTILYIMEDADSESRREAEGDLITEYGNMNEIRGMSEEEKKKREDWYKEEMRDNVAYLEKYGVTYDEEKDQILYDGKTVRWLIDRQIDDTSKAIQMPEGEIDLYTVRSDDFKLTGVRIASQEEYEERTKQDSSTGIGRMEQTCVEDGDSSEEADIMAEDYESGETYVMGKLEEAAAESDKQVQSGNLEETCEDVATEAFSETKEEKEEREREVREYEQAGIGCSQAGGWLWEGKSIYMLADENGSIHYNGSEEAKKNKIYVIVKRNSDGTIKEAKQVTMEEVMKEQMLKEQ